MMHSQCVALAVSQEQYSKIRFIERAAFWCSRLSLRVSRIVERTSFCRARRSLLPILQLRGGQLFRYLWSRLQATVQRRRVMESDTHAIVGSLPWVVETPSVRAKNQPFQYRKIPVTTRAKRRMLLPRSRFVCAG